MRSTRSSVGRIRIARSSFDARGPRSAASLLLSSTAPPYAGTSPHRVLRLQGHVVVDGKVVLVTGIARGCGRVLAEAFAADGAKVIGCDIDVDGGQATTAAARKAGGEMTFVEADVADDKAVETSSQPQ